MKLSGFGGGASFWLAGLQFESSNTRKFQTEYSDFILFLQEGCRLLSQLDFDSLHSSQKRKKKNYYNPKYAKLLFFFSFIVISILVFSAGRMWIVQSSGLLQLVRARQQRPATLSFNHHSYTLRHHQNLLDKALFVRTFILYGMSLPHR